MEKNELCRLFPEKIRTMIDKLPIRADEVREIRFRIQNPIFLYLDGKEVMMDKNGQVCKEINESYKPTKEDLEEILSYISEFSIYAFEEEIKQGFLTLRGGHRVGIVGKPVIENGKIKTFQYIIGLNFRISHEIKGVASELIRHLYGSNGVRNTLIISPPGFGKTTMLRDIIRMISDGTTYGEGQTVGVVDERSEIGGSYLGIPQNDLGSRTDLLDACPKAEGMILLVRSMSPKVIAVDELGGEDDIKAVDHILRSGCKIIATIHGENVEELSHNRRLKGILEENIFERYIILRSPQSGKKNYAIYNSKMDLLGGSSKW
ncbi:MAG: stage III sporulation protein AA [Lachnospiraceae bacterium]|nr:stage III sporulation protein AA [Lachnospiraceae bacterium]